MSNNSGQRSIGVLLGYVSIATRNIAALLLIPYIISHVGISQYGLYSLVTAITGYLVIIELGLSNTAIRFLSKYRATNNLAKENEFFGYIFCLYLFVTAFAIGIGIYCWFNLPSWFASSLTHEEVALLQPMFVVLVVSVAATLLGNSFTGVISSYEKFKFQKALDIFVFLGRCVLVVFLLQLGHSIFAIVIIDTVANIVSCLFKIWFVRYKIGLSITVRLPDTETLKEIGIYTFFIALNVIVNQVNWRLDSLILGAMTNTTIVGIYSIGNQLTLAFIAFASTITGVFMPKFMKMVSTDSSIEKITQELIRVGKYQLLILGLILSCFISFGQLFIQLFVGDEYAQAYWVAMIPMVPFAFVLAQSSTNGVLQAMGKHKVRSLLLIGTAIFNILLSIALVSQYGMIGAAIGTAAALIVGELILVNLYLYFSVKINIVRFYYQLLKSVAPVMILPTLVAFYLRESFANSWIGLMLGCALTLVMYVGLAFFLALSQNEKRIVLNWCRVTQK